MEKIWQPERMVNLELAQHLIEAQFSELIPVSLKWLGEGWDNAVFLVNDRWVFRFPRRQIAVSLLETELVLLPWLAKKLPLTIAEPIFRGNPVTDYNWIFAGYPMIWGQEICMCPLTKKQREALAKPLAYFLRTLHALDTNAAKAQGAPPDRLGRADTTRRKPQTQGRLKHAQDLGLLKDIQPWLSLIADTPDTLPNRPNALIHGDFHIRHILLNGQDGVAGIIDWGDIHMGDPAIDLAIAYSLFSGKTQEIFWDTYGIVSQETRQLARFFSLYTHLALLIYAHDVGHEALFSACKKVLERSVEQSSG